MRMHLAPTLLVLREEINTQLPHQVRWYQRMRGLIDDGVVGRLTWTQMGVQVTY
ncbi:peptidoglycan-binding protein [Micromonospora sp. NPDC005299]|uniref:peptidoglycan-binding domain-containing protein n=1 Tax=Micromonospora sp. NPDC005299 TaxID=3364231 RepID=UPI0036A1CDEA